MGSKAIIAASASERKEINSSPLRDVPASLKTAFGKTPNNLFLRNSDLEKLLEATATLLFFVNFI
jgi:hypothetical protein